MNLTEIKSKLQSRKYDFLRYKENLCSNIILLSLKQVAGTETDTAIYSFDKVVKLLCLSKMASLQVLMKKVCLG